MKNLSSKKPIAHKKCIVLPFKIFTIGMKHFLLYILLLFSVSLSAQDTINQIDANGLKQGYWITYYKEKPEQIKEEGRYKDNKKEGIWKTYFITGKPKSEITYKNNKPNGYAKIYYPNGILQEEGIWKGNKWVGQYRFYHKNGKPAYEWNYNESGKREGIQKYYYDNGQLMIEGNWSNGKEDGVIKEYDRNGHLKVEKTFNNGKMDITSVKFYKPAPVDTTKKTQSPSPQKPAPSENSGNPDLDEFKDSGYRILLNKDKLKYKEGEFKKGKLYNGKEYFYDENKKLIKINIYKKGKLVDIQYKD